MSKKEIKTLSKEFCSANVISAKVGTNTPMGGDASHGGHTIFELKDLAGTEWYITVDGEEFKPTTIKLELYGDTEADTFIEALEFAFETLKKQQSETT